MSYKLRFGFTWSRPQLNARGVFPRGKKKYCLASSWHITLNASSDSFAWHLRRCKAAPGGPGKDKTSKDRSPAPRHRLPECSSRGPEATLVRDGGCRVQTLLPPFLDLLGPSSMRRSHWQRSMRRPGTSSILALDRRKQPARYGIKMHQHSRQK